MGNVVSKGKSLWVETAPEVSYSPLVEDVNVDVAVIGGGIAGLTTAYLLKKQGRQVAVFDKQRIASDISGHTTGKVTSQHGIAYTQLIEQHGRKAAKVYADANQAAIKQIIEEIITHEGIDCDWQRRDNYVFAQTADEVASFKQEATEAKQLGLPATFETSTPLPFAVHGAVRFRNQATFHVGKYLHGLAAAIEGNGCKIYEYTKATRLRDGRQCHFATPNGKVTANAVVLATNVPAPLVTHALYGFKAYPTRSYIVAGRVPMNIEGMHINNSGPSRSILPVQTNGEQWLLVGGEGHFAGVSGPAAGHYRKLAEYAKEHFGMTNVEYQWSTWDYTAYDKLPLIGKAHTWSQNVYVATGFRKWGLTNGTVAGMVLTDLLQKNKNPWVETFSSTRLSALTSMPSGLISGLFTS